MKPRRYRAYRCVALVMTAANFVHSLNGANTWWDWTGVAAAALLAMLVFNLAGRDRDDRRRAEPKAAASGDTTTPPPFNTGDLVRELDNGRECFVDFCRESGAGWKVYLVYETPFDYYRWWNRLELVRPATEAKE